MAIKPILFNSEMVRAILSGQKTCTRRAVKHKYANTEMEIKTDKYGSRLIEIQSDVEGETYGKNPDGSTWHKLRPFIEKEPPYRCGDILYVREAWCRGSWGNEKERYYYKADDNDFLCTWHPSIHMPKEAARIWLKVKDVRVERLQDITSEQVIKEGIGLTQDMIDGCEELETHYDIPFACLWDSTIKKSDLDRYGWAANPWVWVIEFERCEKSKEEK